MPLKAGQLKADDQRRITKTRSLIKENIDARHLIDTFLEREIFGFGDVDLINGFNPDTRAVKNDCFINLLVNSGPTAYGLFLEALNTRGYSWLAKELDDTPLDNSQTEGRCHFICKILIK